MRRIITENNGAGQSFILKTEIVEPMGLVWQVPPGEPMGHEPEGSGNGLHFPSGALVRSFSIPPQEVMAEIFRRGIPGFDERGFHCVSASLPLNIFPSMMSRTCCTLTCISRLICSTHIESVLEETPSSWLHASSWSATSPD